MVKYNQTEERKVYMSGLFDRFKKKEKELVITDRLAVEKKVLEHYNKMGYDAIPDGFVIHRGPDGMMQTVQALPHRKFTHNDER